MRQELSTKTGPMQIRTSMLTNGITSSKVAEEIDWQAARKTHRGEHFMKNLAVAAAVVLCAVTLRTGAIPETSAATDLIMTAATDQSLLDEKLGKLSFVSTLFPEAVLVFGDSSDDMLSIPVSGGVIIHTWSENEPYISWRTDDREVMASAEGEVIGVYHGTDEERIIQVLGADGITCMYGNLDQAYVQTGDWIAAGDLVGKLKKGSDFIFEVKKNGYSVDPALYLAK